MNCIDRIAGVVIFVYFAAIILGESFLVTHNFSELATCVGRRAQIILL